MDSIIHINSLEGLDAFHHQGISNRLRNHGFERLCFGI